MTIDELIDKLEEARDDLGGDVEVLVANQPHYPLSNEVTAVTTGGDAYGITDIESETAYDGDGVGMSAERNARALWIAVTQPRSYSDVNPYAPEGAWTGTY